jgi:hypothetical protein
MRAGRDASGLCGLRPWGWGREARTLAPTRPRPYAEAATRTLRHCRRRSARGVRPGGRVRATLELRAASCGFHPLGSFRRASSVAAVEAAGRPPSCASLLGVAVGLHDARARSSSKRPLTDSRSSSVSFENASLCARVLQRVPLAGEALLHLVDHRLDARVLGRCLPSPAVAAVCCNGSSTSLSGGAGASPPPMAHSTLGAAACISRALRRTSRVATAAMNLTCGLRSCGEIGATARSVAAHWRIARG